MSELSDPLWPVVKPRNGEADAIQEMNAKMVCFHPALERTRRADNKLLHAAHAVVQNDFSVAELFRRMGQ